MADGQAGSRAGSVPVRARSGVGQATLLPSPECVSAGLGVSARSADRARGVPTGRKRASLASSNSWWTYASLRAARRRAVLAHPRRGFCGCCVAVIGITSHKAEPACISGLFTLDTGVVWRAGVRLAQAAWRHQGRTSVTVSSVDDGRWTAACCGGAVVRVSQQRPCPQPGGRLRGTRPLPPAPAVRRCRRGRDNLGVLEKITGVLPLLYRHGLSSGDSVPALGQFLNSSARLSAAVITRFTETWKAGQRAFDARDLSGVTVTQ
jgi:hypothetical protein